MKTAELPTIQPSTENQLSSQLRKIALIRWINIQTKPFTLDEAKDYLRYEFRSVHIGKQSVEEELRRQCESGLLSFNPITDEYEPV